MKKSTKIISAFLAVLTVCSLLGVSAFAAKKVSIAKCSFSYVTTANYTGSAIKPSVTVKYGSKTLKKGTDYTLSYSSNKAVGTGKIKVSGKGSYNSSKTLSFKIVLAKPANVKASDVTSKSAKITWSAVKGASKYVVYSYNSSTKKYTTLATVKTNSATVSLKAGTKYNICVRAFNSKNKSSAYSAFVKFTTLPFAAPKIKLAAASTTSIIVSWNSVASAKGYRIYSYNASTKKYTALKDIAAGKLTYTVTGLKVGTKYGYAVAAYKVSGSSKVLGDKSAVAYSFTAPGKVSGLTDTYIGAKTVNLSWNAVKGATGYQIALYNSSKKTYTKVLNTNSTSASVTGLKPSTSYKYVVRAYNSASGATTAYGAYSAVYTVTTVESNEFYDFRDMIESGQYTISYSMSMDGSKVSMKTSIKDEISAMSMNATIEGMSMKMNMWYDAGTKSGLVCATAIGVLKVYDELDEKTSKEYNLDKNVLKGLFAPEMKAGARVITSTATIDGKKCNTYQYLAPNGASIVYYFYNGKLIQIDAGSETISISSYSATVSDSDIKKPSTRGFMHMDIF